MYLCLFFSFVFVILARFPDYNLSNLADERVDGRQRFSALPQVAVAVVTCQEEELKRSNTFNHLSQVVRLG